MTRLKGGKEVRDSEDEEEQEEEQEEEGKGGELKAFEGNREECKLVLVVRTDLGMGKGMYICAMPYWFRSLLRKVNADIYSKRQNRSSMLARNTSMLQILPPPRPFLPTAETLGVARSSKDCAAGAVGGANGHVARAGCELGLVRAGHPRCGEDADSEWECDGAWGWAGAEKCGRWCYGPFEAAVVWDWYMCIAGVIVGIGRECMMWSLGA